MIGLDSTVSASNNSGESWTTTGTNYCFTPNTYPFVSPYWTYSEDKTAKAFKIVKMLVDKKLIKGELTVEKFITLVDKIVEIV